MTSPDDLIRRDDALSVVLRGDLADNHQRIRDLPAAPLPDDVDEALWAAVSPDDDRGTP